MFMKLMTATVKYMEKIEEIRKFKVKLKMIFTMSEAQIQHTAREVIHLELI